MSNNKRTIYADNSATTKVRDEVAEIMLKILKEDYGNPSSIHQYGQKAKSYLEEARSNIASLINSHEEQIFFTSGGTESNNIVLFGIAKAWEGGIFKAKEKHIITTKIEHPSVKEPLEYLEKKGWKITWLNVDNEGFINIEELKANISTKTLLVSIIHANNEIGTIQDLKLISKVCKENNVLLHTDAVQSYGKIPLDLSNLGVDFMSISSHKIYGPKGAGAIYIKNVNNLLPIAIGGGQENNIRPGTENLPGIVGFGIAAKLLNTEIVTNAEKLRKSQIILMEKFSKLKDVIITGPTLERVSPIEIFSCRLPGHISICSKNNQGESLVLQLDLKGIAVSSGSACSSNDYHSEIKPSPVLQACGIPEDYIKGSLRITLGKDNSEKDVLQIFEITQSVLEKLKNKSIVLN